jgi:hypothetical protein
MGAFFSNPAFPIENISQRFLIIFFALILIFVAILVSVILKNYSESFYSYYFLFKLFGVISLILLTYFIDKSHYQHKIFLLDYFLIPVTYLTIGFIAIQQEVTLSPIFFDKILINVEKYRLAVIVLLFIFISTKVLINFEKGIVQPLNSYISSFEFNENDLNQIDVGMLRRLLFVRYVYER